MLQKHYRPDIDGLRAIAVLAVLLFHADFPFASGGYIGVDIFFVISGFLITRNILFSIENKTFSFKEFYLRRAQRLLPALFFTLLVVFILGLFMFSPIHLERLGQSLLYTTLSVSNFFFWGETGYFNDAAEFKPLLHTWSLGIEEQFYLLWPMLLVGLSLFQKQFIIVLFLLISGVCSLYYSQQLLADQQAASFFLLPFRVFEFSIGALCIWLIKAQPKNTLMLELLLMLGLGLIVWSMVTYTEILPFPGYSALVPCIGAALIIVAGQAPITGTLLRNKLMVGIGLISYSVYLIHWPLLVFYKYWTFIPTPTWKINVLLVTSIVIGYFMWRFIETPFRHKNEKNKQPLNILLWAPISALLLILSGIGVWSLDGLPARFPAHFNMTSEQIASERARYWDEFENADISVLQGDENGGNIVVIGNSHAVDLIYLLRQNGSTANFHHLSTSQDCYNFGMKANDEINLEKCKSIKERNLTFENLKNADAIYLHDHWGKIGFNAVWLEDDLIYLTQLFDEIRNLTNAKIYVFGPRMVYSKPVPEIAHAHMRTHSLNEFSRDFQQSSRTQINNSLINLFQDGSNERGNIFYIDLLAAQCGADINQCKIVSQKNSKFLYFDEDHFTLQGASEIGAALKIKYPELF